MAVIFNQYISYEEENSHGAADKSQPVMLNTQAILPGINPDVDFVLDDVNRLWSFVVG